MAARSLNKVSLIGNLTRDPELRYTAQGTAVCTLGLATNRQWMTENGEKKEEAEFHRIVAWNKLAELCSQLLAKGRKVYVEGRLQTRSWTGADGAQRTTTEIVIDDMIILDSRKAFEEARRVAQATTDEEVVRATVSPKPTTTSDDEGEEEEKEKKEEKKEEVKKKEEEKKKKEEKTKKAADSKEEKEINNEEEKEITPEDIPF